MYDSTVFGCIIDGQEEEYRDLIDKFVEWCGKNYLLLNVAKTKKMAVNFRRKRTTT